MKKTIIIFFILIILLICGLYIVSYYDAKKYVENNKEILIKYPEDGFAYGYYNKDNKYFEIEKTYKIKHNKWNITWNEEDLFCKKSQSKEVNNYINNNSNYNWFMVFDTENGENKYTIQLSDNELKTINELKDTTKNSSVFFDDIEKFGSIIKISKDELVYGTTTIIKHNGNWYYKSDIIDETQEKDGENPTYIELLPSSLNEKILELEKELKNGIK